MGLEYDIESCDLSRVDLPSYLRELPEFLYEADDVYYFGEKPSIVNSWMQIKDDHAYLCLHCVSRETDAMLAMVVRRILTVNDHVMISEI